MPSIAIDENIVTGNPVPKDWIQIRIEKDTAKNLDEIHIERRESYNDIIRRLIDFWKENHHGR